VSALLTEELLEKIMLVKTKHKKLYQGAFKRESPQKQTKPIRSSTI
jgi:hypothetical protein